MRRRGRGRYGIGRLSPWIGALLLGLPPCAVAQAPRVIDPIPNLPGFQKILARGAIPALDDPQFVPAAEAKIADEAWVIGVSDGRVSKAYSINLLNGHEVVNDELGGKPIATTW